MTTDPKILDVERRIAQLESADAQLNAALARRANTKPEVPAPAPMPAIVVEETRLTNVSKEAIPTQSPISRELPSGRIRLWVVYQSELQEIEVDGNLA